MILFTSTLYCDRCHLDCTVCQHNEVTTLNIYVCVCVCVCVCACARARACACVCVSKMAAVMVSSVTQVRSNSDITNVTSVPQCFCCYHLQQELESVLLELQTAKKFIELLHAETNSSAPHT